MRERISRSSYNLTSQGKFLIEVSSLSHLNRIIDKMKKVKGVIEVYRSRRYEPEE
ncbi:MAG: hypothetical protein NTW07_11910 [candidate division Zixibacteria bacterium]|nr:hypothetical protein [candidate division Zixibacteria bacterium]